MTSRERLLKAINFEEPDRVPIDLGGSTGALGTHVIAYSNLLKHLGLPTGTVQSNDVMQASVAPDQICAMFDAASGFGGYPQETVK